MMAPHGFWLVLPVEEVVNFWLDFLVELVFLLTPCLVEDLPIV